MSWKLANGAGEQQAKAVSIDMDEGRERGNGVMAAILASLHLQTADNLFGVGGQKGAHG